MTDLREFAEFLNQHRAVARVRLTRVRGSSPRDTGTEMFIARDGRFGTVGGGRLELAAIGEACAMLARGDLSATMDVALGPEIGQCCGGRVELAISRLSVAQRTAAMTRMTKEDAQLPHVYILGAGHVGRSLAGVFAQLPVRTILVDARANELVLCHASVETRLSALPEFEVRNASPGSAFVVMTHDHGLDFLLASAALGRGDASYVGMIGSATKRASFRSWCMRECGDLAIDGLTCPIGANDGRDKRPAVIALHVAAEIISVLTAKEGSAGRQLSPRNKPDGEAGPQPKEHSAPEIRVRDTRSW